MNEFDDQNGYGSQSRPDYYQPLSSNEPPKQENQPSYTSPAGANTTGYYYEPPKQETPQQQNFGSFYQPPSTEVPQQPQFNGNYYQPPVEPSDNEPQPPKKGKAGKVILIIFIACIVIAVIGLAAGANGSGNKKPSADSSTSQKADENGGDVETAETNGVATKDENGNLTVAGVAEKCMDSCVGIEVYSNQISAYDYFYGYGQQNGNDSSEPTKSGEGSGVILSEKNGKTYIITCAHVISDGDSFKVTTNDRKEYEAKMVAYDAQTDIGVLSIDATGLKVAEFANSEKGVVVGEQVVAIGCPGGLEFMNSITSGYVSALDRPVSSTIGYDNKCIQTDAAINPGNSGGALFNMQGQVIGINSSKIASTEYEGMGFAVPSSTAVATANSLIKAGYVEGRAKIGIEYNHIASFSNASAIINALADKGYKDANGTMVIRVISDESDLKNKDVKEYDMIVAIDGDVLKTEDVITSKLADLKPGDKVTLTIARIEGNKLTIKEVECKLIESKG